MALKPLREVQVGGFLFLGHNTIRAAMAGNKRAIDMYGPNSVYQKTSNSCLVLVSRDGNVQNFSPTHPKTEIKVDENCPVFTAKIDNNIYEYAH